VRSAGPFAAVASLVVVVPVVVVAVFGAGAAPTGQASVGGVGQGLRAGAVPAAYAALVLQAGSICPAAPPSVIAAQIEQESGWDPASISSAGAQGISQFMPGTWPGWSLPGQSPFDPAAAIPAQGRYDCAIAAELEPGQRAGRYGGTGLTSLMLAGYNAGPGAVTAAGGIPNNGETPAYVARITAGAAHYAETTGVVAAGPFGAKVIAAAQSQLGRPYVWGGGDDTGPTGPACGVAVTTPARPPAASTAPGWCCSPSTRPRAARSSCRTTPTRRPAAAPRSTGRRWPPAT